MPRPLLVTLASVVLALAAPALAEPATEAEAEDVAASPRALNGHVFTPTRFLTSPFSTTHLSSDTLYAAATATGPRYDVAGRVIGGRTYSLAAFGNVIEYQYRFADFLALRVGGTAVVFSGIDGPSALVTGATFRYNLGLGLTAGYTLARVVRLAVVFDAGLAPAFDLTIAAGLLRAIQTRVFDSDAVFTLGRTVQLQPGLSVAWAPHPLVGLQGEVRYVYTEVEKSSEANATGDAVSVTALLDLDFGRISPVPLALLGFYKLQDPTEGDKQFRVENAGAGLFYTGRVHLAAGVTYTRQWFDVRPKFPTRANMLDLVVRYYW
jgi:hypothetical protein